MPYVLKEIDDEVVEVNIYSGTIKIGSKEDCDIVVKSDKVLPMHAELYHRMPEYRLAATPSALIKINDKDVERWPVVLNDDDIITFGDVKFKFSILQAVIPRSKRAAFSAYLAAALLSILLVSELLIMLWLPYQLRESKAWELVTAREYTMRQVDKLRDETMGLPVKSGDQNLTRLKALLMSAEDNIATYLRKYGEKMDLSQAIDVRTSLNELTAISRYWKNFSKDLEANSRLHTKTYIDMLVSKLDETMTKHVATRHKEGVIYE